jgi:hypothetical protein
MCEWQGGWASESDRFELFTETEVNQIYIFLRLVLQYTWAQINTEYVMFCNVLFIGDVSCTEIIFVNGVGGLWTKQSREYEWCMRDSEWTIDQLTT